MAKGKKFIKKAVRKAGRFVYKKTGLKNPIKKGKLSSSRVYSNASKIARVASEVAILRRLVNAEKKRITNGVNNQFVGQVNGNSSGMYIYDITPYPSQGVTSETRNGASIKWTTSYLQLQFIHMSATQSTIKGRIYIIKSKDIVNASTIQQQFFMPSPFITSTSIYDINSPREQDYFKDYVVLKTRNFTVKCDQISGQTVQTIVKMPLRFGHHCKYNDNSNVLTDGQVFMLIVTDSGNIATATSSTVGNISVTAPNTGLNLCWSITNYFVDN